MCLSYLYGAEITTVWYLLCPYGQPCLVDLEHTDADAILRGRMARLLLHYKHEEKKAQQLVESYTAEVNRVRCTAILFFTSTRDVGRTAYSRTPRSSNLVRFVSLCSVSCDCRHGIRSKTLLRRQLQAGMAVGRKVPSPQLSVLTMSKYTRTCHTVQIRTYIVTLDPL